MTDDHDRHVTESELKLVLDRIDASSREVKKEVRWLLVLGLAGSQLITNLNLPATVAAVGSITAGLILLGKLVAVFFFAR